MLNYQVICYQTVNRSFYEKINNLVLLLLLRISESFELEDSVEKEN